MLLGLLYKKKDCYTKISRTQNDKSYLFIVKKNTGLLLKKIQDYFSNFLIFLHQQLIGSIILFIRHNNPTIFF